MLPFVLTVSVVLCTGLALVFHMILAQDTGRADKQKFKIGVVGETAGSYLGFGIQAIKTFDSSRFAMEMVYLEEPDAKAQLTDGEIAAYVVIPDTFVEKAVQGEILSLRFVSTSGALSLNTLFKEEITSAVSDILSSSQKGVYGLQHAMQANGLSRQAGGMMDRLAIEYIDFILDRSELCRVEVLGISDNLSLPGYFLCGLFTLFAFFLNIPCAPLLVKSDMAFHSVLVSKRIHVAKQILCEYTAFFILLFILTAVPISVLFLNGAAVPELSDFSIGMLPSLWLRLIPFVATVSCCGFLLFEFVSELISGVLAQFVVSVVLCYIGGCFYPMAFFPDMRYGCRQVWPERILPAISAGRLRGLRF